MRPRGRTFSFRLLNLCSTGGLGILYGNLAPEGCVIKLAGQHRKAFEGPAGSTTRKSRHSMRSRRGRCRPGMWW